jgi:FkbM family methyltransferase
MTDIANNSTVRSAVLVAPPAKVAEASAPTPVLKQQGYRRTDRPLRVLALPRQLLAVVRHPFNRGRAMSAVGRWLRWQLASRIAQTPLLVPFAGDTSLVAHTGETGITGNIYFGLAEYEDMAFAVHLLRPSDLFVDVGANAGSYTILASGVAGARTIAFEPIPASAERLDLNVRVNGLAGRVAVRRIGVGATLGDVRFTSNEDTTNHVALPGEDGLTVAVETLDHALAGEAPVLLKIDTEGFEPQVLAGAAKTLAAPSLIAVIAETNGVLKRYDHRVEDITGPLVQAGFVPFAYEAACRRLVKLADVNPETNNTIFVRDADRAAERLASAPRFVVGAGGASL